MPAEELHALVLAAGAARRFGAVKQLADIGGEPLLLRVVRRAGAAADRTWVILGAHAGELEALLAGSPAYARVNPLWQEGIASSIRTGLELLPHTCAAVMLVLADQPLIRTRDYTRLAQAWRAAPSAIVAARYGTGAGAPAIFPRRCFHQLQQLTGDVGAKKVLQQHAAEVRTVSMPRAGFDIDTPADLAAMAESTIE